MLRSKSVSDIYEISKAELQLAPSAGIEVDTIVEFSLSWHEHPVFHVVWHRFHQEVGLPRHDGSAQPRRSTNLLRVRLSRRPRMHQMPPYDKGKHGRLR